MLFFDLLTEALKMLYTKKHIQITNPQTLSLITSRDSGLPMYSL